MSATNVTLRAAPAIGTPAQLEALAAAVPIGVSIADRTLNVPPEAFE
ncbi:MAG TPA: hypothetical protein VFR14_01420 [Candidatus Limnocylindrales bacterium]|nr:hypothetical protein [Candidatus Limnocylindrales bacterium]